jgi:hypothetical protein
MAAESLLVNYFYAHPVGHAVEALHRLLTARRGRGLVGSAPPDYMPHQQLRLELPAAARAAAAELLARWAPGDPGRIALMPAGSSERALYPSAESWLLVLDALTEAFPGVGIALIGKLRRDARTRTSLGAEGLGRLRAHRSRPIDCFDLPLAEQLATVEACDLFLAPHTGFGLAALAVDTPWLALSGGRWFEYFFNRVPFRSIIPDASRYASFSQFSPAAIVADAEEGPRTPSMSRARILEDRGRIVTAAGELLRGSLTYERAMREYFADLLAAHDGDVGAIWSIDGVHLRYLSSDS